MTMLNILRNVHFFDSLSDDELMIVSEHFHERRLPAGEIVFSEDEIGDSFYILKEGSLEITKRIRDDLETQAELSTLEPYEFFGEMALVDESPRSATAKTITDVVLLRMDKQDFLKICLQYPQVIFNLTKTMSLHLRNTNKQFATVLDNLITRNKLAAIGSAASKIVHDIKTPITVIVLTAQLLESLYPDTAKYIKRIVQQTSVLDDMVREILDFAKGERIALDIKPCCIDDLCSDIMENLYPIAKDRDIELRVINHVESPALIDRKRIKRTLINIVKNGIEALGQGGNIVMETRREDDRLHISICDNGPGIPEEILPSIFEAFVTKGKTDGTGLGLAICKKVVNDHRGEISASNSEEGACFDIYLPMKQ